MIAKQFIKNAQPFSLILINQPTTNKDKTAPIGITPGFTPSWSIISVKKYVSTTNNKRTNILGNQSFKASSLILSANGLVQFHR